MRAVICAIAKYENAYINEWVNYYLALGFDHIYLYDNNDQNTEYVGNFIENKDKVTIFDVRGQIADNLQTVLYTKFYRQYSDTFDWMLAVDIDEFLVGVNNIKDFLAQDKFKEFNQIRIKWQLYDDNDVIERDMSIPVHKFFTNKVYNKYYSDQTKCLVRGHTPENFAFHCNHYVINYRNLLWKNCLPSGKALGILDKAFTVNSEDYANETVYLNHYITKTLSEFLKYKRVRAEKRDKNGQSIWYGAPFTETYFWRFNKKTPEKVKYFEDYLKNNE